MLRIVPVRLSTLCGQLLVVGFEGTTLDPDLRRQLGAGERGGIILFKRNLTDDVPAVRAITLAAAEAGNSVPPFVCVDQEGGRVARLKGPLIALPPMSTLARLHSESVVRDAGEVLGADLRVLGFSSGLAPVLDVDSNPKNPVIGDRAFGKTAEVVTRFALAFAAGLNAGGVAACGKHFPGHGDTATDSHFELPTVASDRGRLDALELAPFRAAASAGIDALMTAHVVYPALDRARPATLSPNIATTLLRDTLGFRGVLFSDDLEMKALRAPVEETAVAAIRAGCDALLVCSRADLAQRAHAALVRACESDAAFRARCEQALARFTELRLRFPSRAERDDRALAEHFGSNRRSELTARLHDAREELA